MKKRWLPALTDSGFQCAGVAAVITIYHKIFYKKSNTRKEDERFSIWKIVHVEHAKYDFSRCK
jgi:hypothetical protein